MDAAMRDRLSRERRRVITKALVWLMIPAAGAVLAIIARDLLLDAGAGVDAHYWQGWISGSSVTFGVWFTMQGMLPSYLGNGSKQARPGDGK